MDNKASLLESVNIKDEFDNDAWNDEEVVLYEPLIDLNDIKKESGKLFVDTLDSSQFKGESVASNDTCIRVKSSTQLTNDSVVDTNAVMKNQIEKDVNVGNQESNDNLLHSPSKAKRPRKCNLKKNLNILEDRQEFACKICDKVFTAKTELTMHVKGFHINADDKIYACTSCDFRTNRKSTLTRHQYTHQSVKRFECALCDKQFIVKCGLLEHIREKHDENTDKPHKCTKCEFQTNRKNNLKQHIQKFNHN